MAFCNPPTCPNIPQHPSTLPPWGMLKSMQIACKSATGLAWTPVSLDRGRLYLTWGLSGQRLGTSGHAFRSSRLVYTSLGTPKGHPKDPKAPPRDPQGTPWDHQGTPKVPQGTPKGLPRDPPGPQGTPAGPQGRPRDPKTHPKEARTSSPEPKNKKIKRLTCNGNSQKTHSNLLLIPNREVGGTGVIRYERRT